ncbi:HutD family protein [Glutamicibacter uratoxydans]|uniref:HutD family protein n=1 Tax=Glutamicibacter uratoxydans TaxID=43667 RepID=UPI001143BAEE|nr:HutD family protein [Glutamicibacter uratoxydans]
MLQTDRPTTARLLDLPQEHWGNGKGATRLIDAHPSADAEEWDWRLSLATLAENSEFSPAGGVVRIVTIASEGPVQLNLNGTCHELSLGMQAQFLDTDRAAITLGGYEQYALNLMVRRGKGYGSVEIEHLRGSRVFEPTNLWHRIVVLAGTVQMEDGTELGPLSAINPTDSRLALRAEHAMLAHIVVAAIS